MFCSMAHNLAISSLFLFMVCIIKLVVCRPPLFGIWGVLLLTALTTFFLFLHRAVVFSIWAAHDINATISRLNLIKKAKKLED